MVVAEEPTCLIDVHGLSPSRSPPGAGHYGHGNVTGGPNGDASIGTVVVVVFTVTGRRVVVVRRGTVVVVDAARGGGSVVVIAGGSPPFGARASELLSDG